MALAARRALRSLAESGALFCQRLCGVKTAASPSGGTAAAGGSGSAPPRKTGIAHSRFTHGNVFVTITDFEGNARAQASAGMCGFKGSHRDSKFAANAVAEQAARGAAQLGMKAVEVRLKGGFGVGKRKYLLRGFKQGGLTVLKIRDVTAIPFNGCRPPKKRRV
ncbi:uncharacterized protein LOC9630158 [Selaginella moellendorffii]|uniref:uncharacterized protein LOC9630158 n=1 Tax=Selaginella moellendorffii TaxID=88036 RepID=UPI000D1CC51F|nr:uncharacterized protein LOC9630158 [Selaginella moellendorffii]|eukprot:XP_002992618.2 uncharacterized protein LOC9630158 [Selaginella moellendorffii]